MAVGGGQGGCPCPDMALLQKYAPLREIDGVPGLIAYQAGDVFELWRAWESAVGCEREPPFWAVVWPAARVLASALLDRRIDVRNARILELGCGGALAAVAALKAGAAGAIANDIDPAALRIASLNAAANGVSLVLDQTDIIAGGIPGAVDTILIADMFYEKQVARHTMALVRGFVERGGVAYIADAGRPFAPRQCGSCICEETVAVDNDLEGKSHRTVRVMALSPDNPHLLFS